MKCLLRCFSVIILFAIVSALFTACKKGENDPAFSLRSRKSRISGEWTMESATWHKPDTMITYNGENMVFSYEVGGNLATDTLQAQHNITFNKDGTYEEVIITDYPTEYRGNGLPAYTLTKTVKGLWNFTGGNNDTKNKSQLLLRVTEVLKSASNAGSNIDALTFQGQTGGFIYEIDRLAGKELTLKYDLVITTNSGTFAEHAEIFYVK